MVVDSGRQKAVSKLEGRRAFTTEAIVALSPRKNNKRLSQMEELYFGLVTKIPTVTIDYKAVRMLLSAEQKRALMNSFCSRIL